VPSAHPVTDRKLMMSIGHPAIVRTVDVVDRDGEPYVVMEYLDGPTLDHVLLARRRAASVADLSNLGSHAARDHAAARDRVIGDHATGERVTTSYDVPRAARPAPLPAAIAVAVVAQVTEALAYLHGCGLLHGDVKASNIVACGQPHGSSSDPYPYDEQRAADTDLGRLASVKMVDLGTLRRLGPPVPVPPGATTGYASTGYVSTRYVSTGYVSPVHVSPGYDAPELAASPPSVATDLYAAARLLAVLALDIPGRSGAYRHRLPSASSHPVLATYPGLDRFLRRGTDPAPAGRYPDAGHMLSALDRLFAEIAEIDAARGKLGDATTEPTHARAEV
jgi:serine/threonine-protein kinase PknG